LSSSDDEDEVAEVAVPVPTARKTHGQKQREIEASRSLEERDSDEGMVQEHSSQRVATPVKPVLKAKSPVKKPMTKQTSPPRSVVVFESSDEDSDDERGKAMTKIPEDTAPMKESGAADVMVEQAILLAMIAPTASAALEPGAADRMGSKSPPQEGRPCRPGQRFLQPRAPHRRIP